MATGTLIQKLIDSHIVSGKKISGEKIELSVDQTLMHDASGTMVCLELEAMGVKRILTELSVIYIDHNTMMIGPENRNDHIFMQSAAKSMGFHFSRHGNGICHQVHLERFGIPGKVLIGADSHTPTNGAMGMIAIGSGGLDVARVIAGNPFNSVYPEIIGVELKGKLKPWTMSKDIILKLLSILTTKGNVGCMVEFFGEGVMTLTVPERAVITNMGAELGVTTSVFPSDEQTLKFLDAQGREDSCIELKADENVEYDRVITLNLSELELLAACPSSPDNIQKISELKNIDVDQIIIGSCTNSSYIDLATIAMILKNKPLNENVTLSIVPGSKQVMETIERDGILRLFIESGVKILESACGACAGQGQGPGDETVSLRTFNRNFAGRSGTKGDNVYLVSPAVAAASAITGKITDPSILQIPYEKVGIPHRFAINDNMIVKPAVENIGEEIVKKSTIKAIPENSEFPAEFYGRVVIKVEDKVTTDHIIPIGKFMKFRSNVYEYAKAVFNCYNKEEVESFAEKCLRYKAKGVQSVILGGLSYGQGSSREHAALCPMYLGVRCVIAKSIERIHRSNLVNFGILPLTFINAEDYDKIEAGDNFILNNLNAQMGKTSEITAILCKKSDININLTLSCKLTDFELSCILAGGVLNLNSKRFGNVA
ncbi:MAG TPA: aconitate hydratase [Victivallales bacterium]|nr:aconitate hydratase [Victivallales bacterium]